MRRWYAVFCKPASERIADANLERQGYITYLPCIAATAKGVGRAPLFPRYLFVSLDLETERWRSIESSYGVAHLVRFGLLPSPLPEGVVEEIRAREGADGLIELPKQVPFQPGDQVAVEGGPLLAQIGVYEGTNATGRARVLMALLGGQVRVTLPMTQLRKSA